MTSTLNGDADDGANATESATWNGDDAANDFGFCVHAFLEKHWNDIKQANYEFKIQLLDNSGSNYNA